LKTFLRQQLVCVRFIHYALKYLIFIKRDAHLSKSNLINRQISDIRKVRLGSISTKISRFSKLGPAITACAHVSQTDRYPIILDRRHPGADYRIATFVPSPEGHDVNLAIPSGNAKSSRLNA
jgi:hypothetical protein